MRLWEKTRFSIRTPELVRTEKSVGTMFVNGRVRGKISGVVDANMYGVIHGEVSAMIDIGTVSEAPEETHGQQEVAEQKEEGGRI